MLSDHSLNVYSSFKCFPQTTHSIDKILTFSYMFSPNVLPMSKGHILVLYKSVKYTRGPTIVFLAIPAYRRGPHSPHYQPQHMRPTEPQPSSTLYHPFTSLSRVRLRYSPALCNPRSHHHPLSAISICFLYIYNTIDVDV